MDKTVGPYVKTLEDELDWKLLDELSAVVLQISNFCFETKKFCVTTLFVVLTLLVKFTKDKPDHAIFVAGAAIPICFWFLDSVAYYYQVKLRGTINAIRERIERRTKGPIVILSFHEVIAAKRVDLPIWKKIAAAVINHSMWIYLLLILGDATVWRLFGTGAIQ